MDLSKTFFGDHNYCWKELVANISKKVAFVANDSPVMKHVESDNYSAGMRRVAVLPVIMFIFGKKKVVMGGE